MELLHVYVELIADDESAAGRYPESLLTCERVVRAPTTSRNFSLWLTTRRPDHGRYPLGQSAEEVGRRSLI